MSAGDSSFSDRFFGFESTSAIKQPCRVASTANVPFVGSTPFGFQTIDGVAVTDNASLPGAQPDRVLLKDQSDQTQNGVWIVQATAWLRAPDWDGSRDLVNGTVVFVIGGVASARVFFQLICADNPIIVGTSHLVFAMLGATAFALPNEVPTSDFAGNFAAADAHAVSLGVGVLVNTLSALTADTVSSAIYLRFDGGKISLGNFNLSAKMVVAKENEVLFIASGTGNVTLNFNIRIFGRWFNAAKDGLTDASVPMQKAYNCAKLSRAALTASSGNGTLQGFEPGAEVVWPDGEILITTGVVCSDPYTFDDGYRDATKIIFRPTVSSAAIKHASAGVTMVRTGARNLSFWSDNPHNVVMTALDFEDLDTGCIEYINISGSSVLSVANYWHDSTNSCIGIRVAGRDQLKLDAHEIQADKPFVIGANPNTTRNSNEDANIFVWTNCYYLPYQNKGVTFEAGCGGQNLTFGPFFAVVGGTGIITLSDTRTGGDVLPSHHFRFIGLEAEQQTDPNAYLIDLQSTGSQPIDFVIVDDAELAIGSHCLRFHNVARILLSSVQSAVAAGKDNIFVDGANSDFSITMRSCEWQLGGNFTLTNYTASSITGFNSLDFAGPSDATYVFAPNPHQIDFRYSGGGFGSVASPIRQVGDGVTLTAGASQLISGAASMGAVKSFFGIVTGDGGGVSEGGIVHGNSAAMGVISGTTNFAATNTASKLCLYIDGSGNLVMLNNTAQTLHIAWELKANLT